MVIIGIDNTLDMARETIVFLSEVAKKYGIRLIYIPLEHATIYRKNKVFSMKFYLEELKKEKKYDLCLVAFTREGIEEKAYNQVAFDYIVFFNESTLQKGTLIPKTYFQNKIRRQVKCDYFIGPDEYHEEVGGKWFTYGWGKTAHLSLTSSEEVERDDLCLQCIFQKAPYFLENKFMTPSEFPIHGKAREPEQLLAGVAVLILYGFDFNRFFLQNNICKMV